MVKLNLKVDMIKFNFVFNLGRFQEERSRMPNHDDYIREIGKHIQIPIIAK